MNGNRSGPSRPLRRQPPVGRPNGPRWVRQSAGAGDAHQNYERYLALARDAAAKGDTVEAENFYQYAEHYFRVTRERAG